MDEARTIAAIATAPGRAGVAVVRVSGPDAWTVARNLTGVAGPEEAPGIALRRLRDDGGKPIDEAVVLYFRSPRSYTGEDVVEFQCHGGTVTPRRVLEACFSAGARLARRGEFTERAFLNGKLDYSQAESVIDLIEAKTDRAADAALSGLDGRMRSDIRALYDAAVEISAGIEHSLDVDEGELPDGFTEGISRSVRRFADDVSAAVRRRREGRILRDGALVVLAGPPNAGKSSLMNVMLGEERAIVSDVAGTTRDSIEEWLDVEGWPVKLVDTAGLRESRDGIEREGVRRAENLISTADIVVWLGDDVPDTVERRKLIAVHSKCDLGREDGALNVSSLTGEGIDGLRRAISAKLSEKAADVGESCSGYDSDLSVLNEVLAVLRRESRDIVLTGNTMRTVAEMLGRVIGAVYSEDMLERLFSRFCVGK
jgi:tRNA modification GTPase